MPREQIKLYGAAAVLVILLARFLSKLAGLEGEARAAYLKKSLGREVFAIAGVTAFLAYLLAAGR